MNPLILIAVPLGLVILGMILNNFGLSFAYPPSSAEQDPAKRVMAERTLTISFLICREASP
jgi:hypothetical protein